MVKPPFV